MGSVKARRKLLLIFFVPMVIFAALFALLCWYLYDLDAHDGYTGEAPGIVIKIDFTPDKIEIRGRTTIHYRYEAGGHIYEEEVSEPVDLRNDYKTGQKIRVCYSPEYPNLSYLLSVESKNRCGDKIKP